MPIGCLKHRALIIFVLTLSDYEITKFKQLSVSRLTAVNHKAVLFETSCQMWELSAILELKPKNVIFFRQTSGVVFLSKFRAIKENFASRIFKVRVAKPTEKNKQTKKKVHSIKWIPEMIIATV